MRCTPLKVARIKAGLLQIELEARTGIRRVRISELENGHYAPRLEELEHIARALGCNLEELRSQGGGGGGGDDRDERAS